MKIPWEGGNSCANDLWKETLDVNITGYMYRKPKRCLLLRLQRPDATPVLKKAITSTAEALFASSPT
jgi:hypothetical protein